MVTFSKGAEIEKDQGALPIVRGNNRLQFDVQDLHC
jgi:hypothetical protein